MQDAQAEEARLGASRDELRAAVRARHATGCDAVRSAKHGGYYWGFCTCVHGHAQGQR